jgi:hypothetical protein
VNSHKFGVGERVDYRPTLRHQAVSAGDFQVESLLPADETGNNQYRIESRIDGHRRVAHEGELAPLAVREGAAS